MISQTVHLSNISISEDTYLVKRKQNYLYILTPSEFLTYILPLYILRSSYEVSLINKEMEFILKAN